MTRQPTPMPIIASSRSTRRCKKCGAPVTFARHAETSRWMCFDADPVALKTARDPIYGLIEFVDEGDLHTRTCILGEEERR
jgi:hypothetical protein